MVRFLLITLSLRYDSKAELPSTAWPCRLRHVPGQSVPILTYDPEPFWRGLVKLQEHGFGSKMQNYKQPAEDPFSDILDDNMPDQISNDGLAHIYKNWRDLHKQTRENLLLFESPDFILPSRVEGRIEVAKLVSESSQLRLTPIFTSICIAWTTKRHCETLSSLQPRLFVGQRRMAIALC
jgi:hypothetical protein